MGQYSILLKARSRVSLQSFLWQFKARHKVPEVIKQIKEKLFGKKKNRDMSQVFIFAHLPSFVNQRSVLDEKKTFIESLHEFGLLCNKDDSNAAFSPDGITWVVDVLVADDTEASCIALVEMKYKCSNSTLSAKKGVGDIEWRLPGDRCGHGPRTFQDIDSGGNNIQMSTVARHGKRGAE